MRISLIAAVVLVGVLAMAEAGKPTLFDLTPDPLKKFLPGRVQKELKNLDLGDLEGLKNVLKKYKKIDSVDEFLKELKKESPGLADIAKELLGKGKSKLEKVLDKLKPQSKDFFKQAANKLKDAAKQLIDLLKSQPKEVKENLEDTLPKVADFIKDEKLQEVVDKLLN
ncbi:CRE-FAR-1 protein [Aphelenchoides avenae]|nr:CRE-FAR-1 protein [Aphelenchus avenae]